MVDSFSVEAVDSLAEFYCRDGRRPEPGVIYYKRGACPPTLVALACPGCGGLRALPLDGTRQWSLVSLDPFTVAPSILCDPDKGGCGEHYYIKGGRVERC